MVNGLILCLRKRGKLQRTTKPSLKNLDKPLAGGELISLIGYTYTLVTEKQQGSVLMLQTCTHPLPNRQP
jgi:hypothetical protein